jgi:hypothetical protein
MSIMRKHLLLLTALAATFTAVAPVSALAGSTSPTAGVHMDPGSPVAKEYALPLATARGAPADTGSNGSLFGSGITKSRGHPNQSGGSPSHSGGSPSQSGDSGTNGSTTPETTSRPTIPAPASTTTNAAVITTTTPAGGSEHHRRPAPEPTVRPVPIPSGSSGAANERVVPTAFRVLHPGSSSGWLWMLLAALIVLTVAGGGTLVLARGRHRKADPQAN